MPNTELFELHPQLAADTFELLNWPLCKVLLMNDRRYVWLILVPAIAGLRELHEVDDPQLWQEIDHASRTLAKFTQAHKMNVAALGNQVPQLHVHVIARQADDAAWPKPVWGVGTAEPYADPEAMIHSLRQALS